MTTDVMDTDFEYVDLFEGYTISTFGNFVVRPGVIKPFIVFKKVGAREVPVRSFIGLFAARSFAKQQSRG